MNLDNDDPRKMVKVEVPVVRCATCDAPWVLRYGLSLSKPPEWYYQKDCKHRTAPIPEFSDAETATLNVLVDLDAVTAQANSSEA